MQMYRRSIHIASHVSRSAAAALVAGAFLLTGHAPAQQGSPAASPASGLSLQASLKAPLDLATATAAVDSVGYSSSTGAAETASAESFNFDGAGDGGMQPPPRRRRYGRPNYNDRWHNTDGSSKVGFVVGGGMTVPTGATGRRSNLSYTFKGGVGVNFSRKLGVIAEFNYDHFGFPGALLAAQTTVYNNAIRAAGGTSADFISGLDGGTHIWSLTLNPTFTFAESDRSSAYLVVGGGFYRKITTFTIPGVGYYCDPYYGYCYQVAQNQVYDHYSNNAGGVNGGIGITHKFSRWSGQKIFAEARYVQTFNSPSQNSVRSLFPTANLRSGYFPVTVGLRW